MSTNKNLSTQDYVLVPWFQLVIRDSKQIADWKGPVDGSTLGEQRVSSKDTSKKFMVCLCMVSVGSVGDAWLAGSFTTEHAYFEK